MYTLRIGIDYELMAFQRFQMRRDLHYSRFFVRLCNDIRYFKTPTIEGTLMRSFQVGLGPILSRRKAYG